VDGSASDGSEWRPGTDFDFGDDDEGGDGEWEGGEVSSGEESEGPAASRGGGGRRRRRGVKQVEKAGDGDSEDDEYATDVSTKSGRWCRR
jgi:hypothetical protein